MDKKELMNRVRLTDEEMEAIEHKFMRDCSSSDAVALSRGHWDVILPVMLEAQLAKVLNDPDLLKGLELLEKVRRGTTIEAIITKKRKRPDLIITDD